MKNFRAADKSHAGGDEKHYINFHWPKRYIGAIFLKRFPNNTDLDTLSFTLDEILINSSTFCCPSSFSIATSDRELARLFSTFSLINSYVLFTKFSC